MKKKTVSKRKEKELSMKTVHINLLGFVLVGLYLVVFMLHGFTCRAVSRVYNIHKNILIGITNNQDIIIIY